MKFFICAFALVAVAFARSPPYFPVDPQLITQDGKATIVSQESAQDITGAFRWSYGTSNGINAGETNVPEAAPPSGEPAPNVVGGYDYTAPNGEVIAVRYTAGKGGFIAEGPHLPVAPPIPEEILAGLAWNAAHPEEEAQWDPAYNKAQPTY